MRVGSRAPHGRTPAGSLRASAGGTVARRKTHAITSALRAELAASDREWARSYAERIGFPPGERLSYYLDRADALDRGEPVEVDAWELPRGVLPHGAVAAGGRYVIELDGTLRPVNYEQGAA
jgi:hypothetical protein